MKRSLFIFCFLLAVFQWNYAAIAVENGLTHQYKVENGKTYRGSIVVKNMANAPQNVKLYRQDLSYNFSGSTFYTDPAEANKTSNAAWVKLSANLITLAGNQRMEVPFEIFVPDGLADPGSYWSVIMVEPVDDLKPGNDKGVHIRSVIRYAIQIITDFKTEDLTSKLKFERLELLKDETGNVLKLALLNVGRVYCSPSVALELYDKKTGQRVGTFHSNSVSLLPDNSKAVSFNLGKIAKGTYAAVLMATDENENAFALETEITIKDD